MNRGFAVTGVVGIIDSRHGILLPNAIADLQKGERYVNTDFAYLSATRSLGVRLAKTSYDIICQWKTNFYKRASAFTPELAYHLKDMAIHFGIPKFHLPAHGSKCWSLYSLNYLPGWARVDGEGIERFWADTNALATSTREMAPGTREDFLDYHWAAANFKKVAGLGVTLASNLKTANRGRRKRCGELEEFISTLPGETVAKWDSIISAWQQDPVSNQDPYQEVMPDYTLKNVEKELERIEDLQVDGSGMSTLTETGFLIPGLELEEHV